MKKALIKGIIVGVMLCMTGCGNKANVEEPRRRKLRSSRKLMVKLYN